MFHLREINPRRLATGLTLFAGAFSAPQAQSIDYDVANLGEVPGAYLTYGHALNDHGVVVGSALYIPGGIKAWTWTESQGYTILPQPPVIGNYAAVDINDDGVIAGDGGGDGGEVWRYTDGTYELLGVLPGTAIPHTEGINASGSITGTCFGTLFYYPRHSFLAVPGAPMISILDNSEAYGINDAGQITGTQAGVAYRITPGVGVEMLPPLGVKNLTAGYAINNAGKVVGVAGSTAEHDDVPFLYSDADGMQEIGDFGGRANAADVSDLDEVVGNYEPFSGVRMPWVWSQQQGVRFLNDVIDPALGLSVRYTYGINDAGQILCDARDQDSNVVPLLLSPVAVTCQPDLGFGGPGTAVLSLCGDPLATGGSATLQMTGAPALATAFLGYSTSFHPTAMFGGTVVPVPPIALFTKTTDANGEMTMSIPGGGGPLTIYAQMVVLDPGSTSVPVQVSNAIQADLLP